MPHKDPVARLAYHTSYMREYAIGECRKCGTMYEVWQKAFCPEHGFEDYE